MPFERTTHAGLTVAGSAKLEGESSVVDLGTLTDWQAQVDESILFPTGLLDDGFLHVSPAVPRNFLFIEFLLMSMID